MMLAIVICTRTAIENNKRTFTIDVICGTVYILKNIATREDSCDYEDSQILQLYRWGIVFEFTHNHFITLKLYFRLLLHGTLLSSHGLDHRLASAA